MTKNLVSIKGSLDRGIFSASFDGRSWTGTIWTRDAGVFLRELALWGYCDQACWVVKQLIRLVQSDSHGNYTFPERPDIGNREVAARWKAQQP
jgi:hypothetical protein